MNVANSQNGDEEEEEDEDDDGYEEMVSVHVCCSDYAILKYYIDARVLILVFIVC